MERNPNKTHCKTNVIYLLIHVAQASTSSTFGFQKFFSIYQCFSSIHHPHQHHHFHSITNTPKWSNPKRASCAIHHLLLHLSICYIHHQLSSSSFSQQKWSNSESTSMCNPSSSFASIYILHPLILIIIFTAFIDTQKWPNSESVSMCNSSSFFSIYLFFTFLILIIIFIAFINTQKGPNLNVHSWEIHHVLFRLSIFNILHHHHFHSIYKHPKKLSNPDCASMGNPWLSFSSIKFSHPSASSSFTQCYKHPKLVISWLCIHGQSKIFFCFHLFFRYIIVIVIIIIIIFTTL